MLLLGGRRLIKKNNIGGDDDWFDLLKRIHAMLFAPDEELRDGLSVGRARVPVPDRCREEFDEAPGRGLASATDDGRQMFKTGARQIPPWDRHKVGTHGRIGLGSGRRDPNSSGSIRSAGSISLTVAASAGSVFRGLVGSRREPRFKRFFASPQSGNRSIITSFMIRPGPVPSRRG